MEDEVDFELGEDALEQVGIGNRAGELAERHPAEGRVERRDVDGDDRAAAGASRVISPWPISPPAPVTSVTGRLIDER